MKFLFALVSTIFVSFLLMSCDSGPLTPPSAEASGSAELSINVGQVGSLAKTTTIEFKKLCLALSASGETTIYDTVDLSGNGAVAISRVYDDLASLKTWTLSANSLDANDSLIHRGSTTFEVRPRQTTSVTLDLSARFSMLKATFKPIRDSVTRCELLVDGVIKADSLFTKQSLFGSSVRLDFDYLRTGWPQVVVMNVYGDMWGFDTLLYTGSILLNPLAGNNSSFKITLHWVGPSTPPPGQATMIVSLGPVGTIELEGELAGRGGILFGRGTTSAVTSLWLMNADGTNQRQIYQCATDISSAVFNPDSSKLFFSKNSPSGISEIYSLPFNGGLQPEGAALQLSFDNVQASRSPQFVNGKIWYLVFPDYGITEVVQIDMDGSNREQITNFAARGKQICHFKVFGDKIVYALQSPSWSPTSEVYLANLDFTEEVQLTSNGEIDAWGNMNNSHTLIVVGHADGGGYSGPFNLYSLDVAGGNLTKLTNATDGASGYVEPRFSPDNAKIACYYYEGSGNGEIMVMSTDGSGMVNLTNTPTENELLFDWK